MGLTKVTRGMVLPFSLLSKTSDYTVVDDDDFIIVDASSGAITITMPSAATRTGASFRFRKLDATLNNVDLGGVFGMANPQQVVELTSDGSIWFVSSINTPIRYSSNTSNITPTGTVSASWASIVFGSLERNIGTAYNVSTGSYTSPKDGVLQILARIGFSYTTAANVTSEIRARNLTTFKDVLQTHYETRTVGGSYVSLAGSLEVLKGEVVQLQGRCFGTTPGFLTTSQYISISYNS